MPTRVSDLWNYDEEFPPAQKKLIDEIENAGNNPNLVEAHKLRVQVALTAEQNAVQLYVNDETERRSRADAKSRKKAAAAELAAANTRAESADKIAKSLTRATWVLAIATGVLVVATIASVVVAILVANREEASPAAPSSQAKAPVSTTVP